MEKKFTNLFCFLILITIFGCNINVPVVEQAPAKISNLNVVSGYRHVKLSWKNPSDSDLQSVLISWDNGKRSAYLPAAPGRSGSYTAGKLVNDTEYTFSLIAQDAKNFKSAPTSKKATPRDTIPPDIARDLIARSGNREIYVTWKEPYNNDFAYSQVKWYDSSDVFLGQSNQIRTGDPTDFTITGLTNDTDYKIKLITADSNTPPNLIDTEILCRPRLPSVEARVSAVHTPNPSNGQDGSFTIEWDNAAAYEPTDRIKLEFYHGSLDATASSPPDRIVNAINPSNNSYTFNNLPADNRPDSVRVSAYENTNPSRQSDVIGVEAVPPDKKAPDAPGGFGAYPLNRKAGLRWAPPSGGDVYKYEIKVDYLDSGSWAPFTSHTPADLSSISFARNYLEVGGLDNDTEYRFKIRAYDYYGNYSSLQPSVRETPAIPAPALIPFDTDRTAITVRWSNAADYISSDEIKITVYEEQTYPSSGYSLFGSPVSLLSSSITPDTDGVASYQISGLTTGTRYKFTVEAKDSASGTSATSESIATARDLVKPGNVRIIQAIGEKDKIRLRWENPPDPDLVKIRVRYGNTVSGRNRDVFFPIQDPLTDTEGEIVGLASGMQYFVYLYAIDSSGNEGAVVRGEGTRILSTEAASDNLKDNNLRNLKVEPRYRKAVFSWHNPYVSMSNFIFTWEDAAGVMQVRTAKYIQDSTPDPYNYFIRPAELQNKVRDLWASTPYAGRTYVNPERMTQPPSNTHPSHWRKSGDRNKSYSIENLAGGHLYNFVIGVYGADGDLISDVRQITVTPLNQRPNPVTGLTYRPKDRQILVRWNNPADTDLQYIRIAWEWTGRQDHHDPTDPTVPNNRWHQKTLIHPANNDYLIAVNNSYQYDITITTINTAGAESLPVTYAGARGTMDGGVFDGVSGASTTSSSPPYLYDKTATLSGGDRSGLNLFAGIRVESYPPDSDTPNKIVNFLGSDDSSDASGLVGAIMRTMSSDNLRQNTSVSLTITGCPTSDGTVLYKPIFLIPESDGANPAWFIGEANPYARY